jgi:hypothetical protein
MDSRLPHTSLTVEPKVISSADKNARRRPESMPSFVSPKHTGSGGVGASAAAAAPADSGRHAAGYVSNTPADHPYYVEYFETPSSAPSRHPLLRPSELDSDVEVFDDEDIESHYSKGRPSRGRNTSYSDMDSGDALGSTPPSRHLSSSSVHQGAGLSSSDIEASDVAASAGDVYIDVYTSGSPVLGRLASSGWSDRKQKPIVSNF